MPRRRGQLAHMKHLLRVCPCGKRSCICAESSSPLQAASISLSSHDCSPRCLCRAVSATSAGHSPNLFTSTDAAGQGSAGQAEKGSTQRCARDCSASAAPPGLTIFIPCCCLFSFFFFSFFSGEIFVILILKNKTKSQP